MRSQYRALHYSASRSKNSKIRLKSIKSIMYTVHDLNSAYNTKYEVDQNAIFWNTV